ncbi:MAG: hypothetical protein A2Y10_04960 [Planctomycetes bacterium GWF2_41_51]|nr:MAG: hypothetical protein A2Y10_04960 [Planctomycetes bacterium GWF2_41_51]HBG25586.1 hypothetical protein [Phycisphaerales bacterium]
MPFKNIVPVIACILAVNLYANDSNLCSAQKASKGTLDIISKMKNQPNKTGITNIWIINPLRFSESEKVLLATLQGLTSKQKEIIWINSGGMDNIFLNQFKDLGINTVEIDSVWELLPKYSSTVKGFMLYKSGNNSINAATSLCGPYSAVAIHESQKDKIESFGFKMLADVRNLTEKEVFEKNKKLFTKNLMAEQNWKKSMYLRDFLVANNAFVFWDPQNVNRSEYLSHLNPGSLIYGFGNDELEWVKGISKFQCAGIPSDWSLNLSIMSRLPVKIPNRPHKKLESSQKGQRLVCFVMSDGDNIQWLAGGFVNSPGFWASKHRGNFNMTWEIAPIFSELAPKVLEHYYLTATDNDDFVVGSSGLGYCFPSYLPDRKAFVKQTIPYMKKSKLSIVSILNADGDMSVSKEFLDQPDVFGVLYKDYEPYNKEQGKIYWHNGKPCVSYKYLLWENMKGASPAEVANAINNLPASAEIDPNSYALINVHAWSFNTIGGPMEAIKQTIDRLDEKTKVVTAQQFIEALTKNISKKN